MSAGDASVADWRSAQNARPKCSTPLLTATAMSRARCARGGAFKNAASTALSSPRRRAVNRSGGSSRSASFETKKLPAQVTQTTASSAQSEGVNRFMPPSRRRSAP